MTSLTGRCWIPPFRLAVIFLLVLGAAPSNANAQGSVATPYQPVQEGLRREEERARTLQQQLQPRPPGMPPEKPESRSAVLIAEVPCFVIQDIAIAGPDAPRFHWLADKVQVFIGQCAGAAGLQQITADLNARLIDLGYVTSGVSLAVQNLSDGRLVFTLHVGRVAKVGMLTADMPSADDDRWGTWRNAFPLSPGEILNVRDLEQGVEQMKRLPSQAVSTELEPGAGFNTSNIRILRQAGTLRQRTRGGVTIDNSGGRTLGKAQVAAYLSLDNPLGLNDIFSVSAGSNGERLRSDHRSQSLSFQYSIPWGYDTFTFSKSLSRFAQKVQGTTVQFLSSGRSESVELKWQRTVLRTSASRLGVYAVLGTRRASSQLDDVELIVQRQRTTSVETGLSFRHLEGDAIVDMELGYRRGMAWHNAQEDFPDAAAGGLTNRPHIASFTASVLAPFKLAGQAFQYQATARAQYTTDTTLSVDQFSIGGRHSVRGFDGDSVLLAESGFFLRNELSVPVRLASGVDTAAYAGIDFGRVWGLASAQLVGDRLAGAAIGVRAQFKTLQAEIAVGTPLYKPEAFRSRRWNPYLTITQAF